MLVVLLIPPVRRVESRELRYIFLGLTGSILFFAFSALFLNDHGNYIGRLPFPLALALLSLVFFSVASFIYWSQVDQRKRLGLVVAFNLVLVVVLSFLILRT